VVDDELLAAIHQRFHELDADGSGRLTREDFVLHLIKAGAGGNGSSRNGNGEAAAMTADRAPSTASSLASVAVDVEGGGS
jgi:hypothetical protein